MRILARTLPILGSGSGSSGRYHQSLQLLASPSLTLHVPQRSLHSTPLQPATVSSIPVSDPLLSGLSAPLATSPSSTQGLNARIERRRKQAELLKSGGSTRAKRFWKEVIVVAADDGYQIHLDRRPLRRPNSKSPLVVPRSKPHLATALALEWDLLTSAQQALKSHLIPLTGLVNRALDISEDDDAGKVEVRSGVVDVIMRYLDTDSLLCWAPPPDPHTLEEGRPSLRELQKRAADEFVGHLTSKVWPGVEIRPVLGEGTIVPTAQPQVTRDVIKGWVTGLPAWELAGLERAVLAGKGLLCAARLLTEWSETLGSRGEDGRKFGVEEAVRASSLEVDWQIGMWGEVEDTHDVDREDLRRQLGSVVLLVSGDGK